MYASITYHTNANDDGAVQKKAPKWRREHWLILLLIYCHLLSLHLGSDTYTNKIKSKKQS